MGKFCIFHMIFPSESDYRTQMQNLSEWMTSIAIKAIPLKTVGENWQKKMIIHF